MDATNGRKPIPWTFILPFALTLAAGFLAVYRSFVSIQDITARQEKRIEALEAFQHAVGRQDAERYKVLATIEEKLGGLQRTDQRLEVFEQETRMLLRQLVERERP